MNYIVLDMEWNQPWPGSPSAKKVLPVQIRGEIIQIGAVRVTEDQQVADEFQIMVKPKYYRHLNRRVSKLTGIKETRLREEGVPFPEAIEQFKDWCGEDIVFLTWGFDDIGILRENLQLFQLGTGFTDRWYNAQMIFNAQTDGSTSQKALKTAMEIFGIEASRPAHDALGDAYHTALICARLDLKKGAAEYDAALKSHENGFHGAELPGCIARSVFHDYADKRAALSAMAGEENRCPICEARMLGSRWFAQPGHRYMDLATCPEHGKFLIRVRLSEQPDGLVRVSRLTYEATSEAAEAYARRAEKADPEDAPVPAAEEAEEALPQQKTNNDKRRRPGGTPPFLDFSSFFGQAMAGGINMTEKQYGKLVSEMMPKSPIGRDCFNAFWIGGLICALGQVFLNGYTNMGLDQDAAGTAASMTLVALSALLTGLSLYDNLAKHAGAGTLVPITGFANSIAAPAVEFKTEGFVLGVGAKMFTIAGPVIVYGLAASVVYGLVYWGYLMLA